MHTTPNATPVRTARRRTGTVRRLAAAALAGLALSAAGPAALASAESLPAPTPSLGLAADVNTHTVADVVWSTGDTWADVIFTSTRPTVTVQFGGTAPKVVDGVLTMGPVAPEHLTGTPIGGGRHRFTFSRTLLGPARTYHVLFTVPGSAGQAPNRIASSGTTKTRFVRMTPVSLHVVDDGDAGIKGAGEVFFGFRVAPAAHPAGAGVWGSWTHGAFDFWKLHSGDDVHFGATSLGHTVAHPHTTAVVQVQGQENDQFGAQDWGCGIGMNAAPAHIAMAPVQGTTSCFDSAYAEGVAQLPTGRYQGVHAQVVDVAVQRTPALRFTGKVLVQTWHA